MTTPNSPVAAGRKTGSRYQGALFARERKNIHSLYQFEAVATSQKSGLKRLLIGATFILQIIAAAAMGGEISDQYARTHSGTFPVSGKSRSGADIRREDRDITEIGVEHTGCLGSCEVYTLIVKSDGSFRYSDGAHVERKGQRTGKIRLWRLGPLLQYVREIDYFGFDERYQAAASDQDTVVTMIVKGNQRKTISNYGNAGPIQLWALQELISSLLVDAEWDTPK